MKNLFALVCLIFSCALCLPDSALAAAALPLRAAPNMLHIYATLGILLAAAILFFTEWFPLAVTATLVPCVLSTFGIISVKEAWMGFGNTSILTIIGLFMLGEATFVTGFAQKCAGAVISKAGKSEKALLVVSIVLIGVMSAFLNNAGITAITLPMLISIARRAKMSPSRILLPTAFAASVGGTMTLVGTAPNMVANALILENAEGMRTFGFFEFGLFGLPFLVVVILMYVLLGRWLLPPNRKDTASSVEQQEAIRPQKMYIAGGLFLFVIVSMASGLVPLTSAAMLGAMLAILTGCITVKEAFKSVDWSTIFLFAGMLAMSHAMSKSGAASLMANAVIQVVSDPYLILASTCLLTMIVTNVMSNTATTAVMVPLVIPMALALNYNPLTFVMGIVVSASSCFLTPIATPSNTLVLVPGNYAFKDYVKYGWPLQLAAFVMIMLLVPRIWPFADYSFIK